MRAPGRRASSSFVRVPDTCGPTDLGTVVVQPPAALAVGRARPAAAPERTCPRSPPARRPAPPGQAAEDVRRSPGPSPTGRAGRSSGQRGTAPTRAIGPEGTIGSATTMTQMARVEAPIERTTTPPAPATGGPDDVAEAQPAESRYLNRELSWLDFNARVLALAEDPAPPLLERAKFLAIFARTSTSSSRCASPGLQEQVDGRHPRQRRPTGSSPLEQLRAIRDARATSSSTRQAATFTQGRRARARRTRASASATGTSSTPTTGRTSTRSSRSASSPCSRRSRSTRRTRSPTSRTCR